MSAYGSSTDRTGSWDVWTQVYGARSIAGDSKSTLWVGYAGGHIFVSPDLMVGAMGQMDWADESNSTTNTDADGFGWMIGPYIAGRIPGKNVFYEARVSWGQSDNNISPIGTYTDSFETERWMAYGKISGAYEVGKITIKPEASLGWFEEKQEAYTDSLANVIPSQTVSLGEIRIGPSIEWKHLLDDGTVIRPSLGVSGVMNFGIADNSASQGSVLGNKDIRARFNAGISATNAMGWIFNASGYHDGLGINDYHSYGGTLKLTVPLN